MLQKSAEESVHRDVGLDHVLDVGARQLGASCPMPAAHHGQLPGHPGDRGHHLVVVVPQLQGQCHREGLK